MCKIIQFPKIRLEKSIEDKIFELQQFIDDRTQTIELCEGYNENYKDGKTIDEYERDKAEIEQMKIELEERKRELEELERSYIFGKDVIY